MYKIRSNRFTELAGWYGMLAILAAYALVSFKVVSGTSLLYQLLSLTGGSGLFIVTAAKDVMQSVILNAIWIIVGLIAISKIVF